MDRNTLRVLNEAQRLTQSFPDASSGDNVVVNIYDLDDNNQDLSDTAMTYETGVTWTYAWTPAEQHNYIITYTNNTQGVSHYEYVKVVGSTNIAPAGSASGSTLTTLQKEFLLNIDSYNANDLSGDGSSGDMATKCINKALQKIYSVIKDNELMQAYPSTSLVSTSGVDYIALSAISDLDEIASIRDTANTYKLIYIPPYRATIYVQ